MTVSAVESVVAQQVIRKYTITGIDTSDFVRIWLRHPLIARNMPLVYIHPPSNTLVTGSVIGALVVPEDVSIADDVGPAPSASLPFFAIGTGLAGPTGGFSGQFDCDDLTGTSGDATIFGRACSAIAFQISGVGAASNETVEFSIASRLPI